MFDENERFKRKIDLSQNVDSILIFQIKSEYHAKTFICLLLILYLKSLWFLK